MTHTGLQKTFDLRESHDRAFLRLCAMGRVATKELGERFLSAWSQLPYLAYQTLVTELNIDGLGNECPITVYYMSALFGKVLHLTADCSEEKQVSAIKSVMMFMSRAYNSNARHRSAQGVIVEVDVRDLIEFVEIKGAEFVENPSILDECEIELNEQ
ncbi:uncharacterized protein BO80DRAFT_442962 [Aspergillus ibericus CBS 121593]|uniref:Uncharacterized protein n=1 Tax=Aspergillus ibericus CBS 121593 TaxID=1448316 RepID=A0A395H818_9EURO|nr:hypothetical protein BO80DRAFT_442962 [Aspergillus ibericus CBS 121593]RAL03285.1 hypothetical protein BO80DRAFT_442962 [Aspergillus ibericus CBS 121593]